VWFVIVGLVTKIDVVLLTYKPYSAAKLFLPLLALALALKVATEGTWRRFLGRELWPLYGLAALVLLPVGYAFNAHDWELYQKWTLSFGSYMVLFLAIYAVADDAACRRRLLIAIIAAAAVGAIYSLMQAHLGTTYAMGHARNPDILPRPWGPLDDPNFSSGVFIIGLFFSLYLMLPGHRVRRWGAWGGAASALLFVWALAATQSMGALLALAIGAAALPALVLLLRWRPERRTLLVALVAGEVAILLAFLLFVALHEVNAFGMADTLTEIKTKNVSARIASFRYALDLFRGNPVFGAGPWNDFHRGLDAAYGYTAGHVVHNTLLAIVGTLGLLGAAMYGLLVLWCIRGLSHVAAHRRQPWHGVLAAAIPAALFLTIQAQSQSLQMITSIPLWISLALPYLIDPADRPGSFAFPARRR
jgi:O-antigen ligase